MEEASDKKTIIKAADVLAAAAQVVIDCWDEGNLEAAVNELQDVLEIYRVIRKELVE